MFGGHGSGKREGAVRAYIHMPYKVGNITIHFSGGSVFRTFITAPKIFTGTPQSVEQRMQLCNQFNREIHKRGGYEEDINKLVSLAENVITSLRASRKLTESEEDFLEYTANTVQSRYNQEEAEKLFQSSKREFVKLIQSSSLNTLFAFICKSMEDMGINRWVNIDGTISAVYGSANFGTYLPDIGTIGIQIDKILERPNSELGIADTSFHEELHTFSHQDPIISLPEPIEEEACNITPKELIASFLSTQKKWWGGRKYSQRQIENDIASLYINESDKRRNECVTEKLGGDRNWGIKMMLAAKTFPEDERKRMCSDSLIINKIITQIWPGTLFRIPFYCEKHHYGIG